MIRGESVIKGKVNKPSRMAYLRDMGEKLRQAEVRP